MILIDSADAALGDGQQLVRPAGPAGLRPPWPELREPR